MFTYSIERGKLWSSNDVVGYVEDSLVQWVRQIISDSICIGCLGLTVVAPLPDRTYFQIGL